MIIKKDPNDPIDLYPFLKGRVVEVTLPTGIKPIAFQERILEVSGIESLPGTIVHMVWILFGAYKVETYYYFDGTSWQSREAEKVYFSHKVLHDTDWAKQVNFDLLRGCSKA